MTFNPNRESEITPEGHLIRWLVSLKHDAAVRAIQALTKSETLNLARLVTEARRHQNNPQVRPSVNLILESLLGNGD